MSAILFGGLCLGGSVCGLISSVVAGLLNEDDTPPESLGPSSSTSVDKNGKVLKGYIDDNLMAGDRGFYKATSIGACRDIAKKLGYPGFGYRNSTHPEQIYKDTCFFYTDIKKDWTGNDTDTARVSGCTDPSKTWAECSSTGGTIPGWTSSSFVNARDKGTSITECRSLGKSKGYKGIGFRTSAHPDPTYRNTCYYYSATDSKFKGDFNDNARVSGCTDASKNWPNC